MERSVLSIFKETLGGEAKKVGTEKTYKRSVLNREAKNEGAIAPHIRLTQFSSRLRLATSKNVYFNAFLEVLPTDKISIPDGFLTVYEEKTDPSTREIKKTRIIGFENGEIAIVLQDVESQDGRSVSIPSFLVKSFDEKFQESNPTKEQMAVFADAFRVKENYDKKVAGLEVQKQSADVVEDVVSSGVGGDKIIQSERKSAAAFTSNEGGSKSGEGEETKVVGASVQPAIGDDVVRDDVDNSRKSAASVMTSVGATSDEEEVKASAKLYGAKRVARAAVSRILPGKDPKKQTPVEPEVGSVSTAGVDITSRNKSATSATNLGEGKGGESKDAAGQGVAITKKKKPGHLLSTPKQATETSAPVQSESKPPVRRDADLMVGSKTSVKLPPKNRGVGAHAGLVTGGRKLFSEVPNDEAKKSEGEKEQQTGDSFLSLVRAGLNRGTETKSVEPRQVSAANDTRTSAKSASKPPVGRSNPNLMVVGQTPVKTPAKNSGVVTSTRGETPYSGNLNKRNGEKSVDSRNRVAVGSRAPVSRLRVGNKPAPQEMSAGGGFESGAEVPVMEDRLVESSFTSIVRDNDSVERAAFESSGDDKAPIKAEEKVSASVDLSAVQKIAKSSEHVDTRDAAVNPFEAISGNSDDQTRAAQVAIGVSLNARKKSLEDSHLQDAEVDERDKITTGVDVSEKVDDFEGKVAGTPNTPAFVLPNPYGDTLFVESVIDSAVSEEGDNAELLKLKVNLDTNFDLLVNKEQEEGSVDVGQIELEDKEFEESSENEESEEDVASFYEESDEESYEESDEDVFEDSDDKKEKNAILKIPVLEDDEGKRDGSVAQREALENGQDVGDGAAEVEQDVGGDDNLGEMPFPPKERTSVSPVPQMKRNSSNLGGISEKDVVVGEKISDVVGYETVAVAAENQAKTPSVQRRSSTGSALSPLRKSLGQVGDDIKPVEGVTPILIKCAGVGIWREISFLYHYDNKEEKNVEEIRKLAFENLVSILDAAAVKLSKDEKLSSDGKTLKYRKQLTMGDIFDVIREGWKKGGLGNKVDELVQEFRPEVKVSRNNAWKSKFSKNFQDLCKERGFYISTDCKVPLRLALFPYEVYNILEVGRDSSYRPCDNEEGIETNMRRMSFSPKEEKRRLSLAAGGVTISHTPNTVVGKSSLGDVGLGYGKGSTVI